MENNLISDFSIFNDKKINVNLRKQYFKQENNHDTVHVQHTCNCDIWETTRDSKLEFSLQYQEYNYFFLQGIEIKQKEQVFNMPLFQQLPVPSFMGNA